MRIFKAPRFTLLSKPFMQRDRVDLISTLVNFIPFDNPEEPMLEEEAWPIISEQLVDIAMDTGDPKANGEWLAHGFACAPTGNAVTEIDVSIALEGEAKTLRVVGEREWLAENRGPITVTNPVPFEVMPILPARAFGGVDFKDNPAGQGYWPKKDKLENYKLPSIMYQGDTINAPGDIMRPAYYGPRDLMLPERQELAGTYDQHWAETSFPGLPEDFDCRFYQAGQEDQQIQGFFSGTETFHIKNMHPEFNQQTVTLPGIRSRCFITINRQGKEQSFEEIPMVTDTVYLFPGSKLAVLIHRGTVTVESMDFAEVESILGAFEWSKDPKRPVAHYEACRDVRSDRETAAQALLEVAELYPEKWIEPEEKLAEVIKPRDPSVTRDGTSKLDALWGKWKGIIDAGLVDSGLPPYDELVASRGGVLDDDPEVGAIRKELEKLQSTLPRDAKELKEKGFQNEKLNEMINVYMDKHVNAVENYFRRQCAVFGYDFDDLKAKARAEMPKETSGIKGFINAELKRIVDDQNSPTQVREAAIRATSMMEDSAPDFDKLDDLEIKAKTFLGHKMPKAPALVPASNDDLRVDLINGRNAGERMQRKDLRGADLSGLDLSGTDFEEADFTSANLTGTNLEKTRLDRACFAFADLTGAVLDGASAIEANFGEAVLAGTSLSFSDLEKAVFSKAAGSGARFVHSNLREANFMECKLPEAEFLGGVCVNTLFLESIIPGAWFNAAELDNIVFVDCKAHRSKFFSATGSNITIVGGDFSETDFRTAELESLALANNPIFDRSDFKRVELKLANFRGASLQGADFSDASLAQADFSETDLFGASFERAFARNSRFHRAKIDQVNFKGTDLMDANFLLAKMTNSDAMEANFFNADLMKAEIQDTSFENANIARTRLEGFRFP